MNLNASAGLRQPLGRKVKRVSDVKAMGSPMASMAPMAAMPGQQPPMPGQQPPPFNTYGDNYGQQMPPYSGYPSQQQYAPEPGYQSPPGIVPMGGQEPHFNMLAQPAVQNMAFQYGTQLANTGKELVKSEIERYVPVTKLKYYFAVDTKYVLSKLKLLFFPFTHGDWSVKYEQDTPVQPRFELNAPDLYIPTMAYVTYVLVAGLVLGMQQRFSPEQIGILASSALAWTIFEIFVYSATLYITNIHTTLKILDLLAYSGYKYVGIIASVLVSAAFSRVGYYLCLIYCSLALAFLLVRSLKAQVLPDTAATSHAQGHYYAGGAATRPSGGKRRLYFLLFVAAVQPLLSWWLTFHLVSSTPVISSP